MDPGTLQALVLRTVGTVECLAFVAVVVPYRWLAATHEWLGLGEMPESVVLRYLIREASFVYGVHGILLWLLAGDVVRFRPLIRFTGFSYFISGPIIAAAGAVGGMPWFWFIGEGLSCLAVGIVLLWLTRVSPTLSRSESGHRAPEAIAPAREPGR